MKGRSILLAALALAACPAFGLDLWNQQVGVGPAFASFPDQEYDDGIYDVYTTYMANDVIVGAGGWNVDSISVEMTASSVLGSFTTLTTARLNVFANPGGNSVPAVQDDPSKGVTVPVSVVPVGGLTDTYYVIASNLNLNLAAGEYWIDLTPVGGVLSVGQSYEVFTPTNSAGAHLGSATINPLQGYQFPSGPNWGTMQDENHTAGPEYGAIDIQGAAAAPEPSAMVGLAAGIFGLLRFKRRRDKTSSQ